MATRKVTITLDLEQLARIRDLVGTRQTPSVSGFIKHAVNVSLNDVAGWGALLAVALERTGGPLTKTERAWADGVLAPRKARGRKGTRKAA